MDEMDRDTHEDPIIVAINNLTDEVRDLKMVVENLLNYLADEPQRWQRD